MLHALSGILIEGVGVHGRPGGKPTWGPLAHAALRHLIAAGHEPDLFIGTSAGAINAILFAAGAHLPADEQADTALAVWRSVEIEDVFRPLLRTGPGTIARWAGQLCRIPGMRLTSLVDTAPLARTAHRLIDWTQLAANLDGGKASLAVVTTSAATKRTVIFVDGSRPDPLPPSDTTRPIDYLGVRITDEHVLGSAAIPALFPAVEVSTPDTARGWYADGGIRLNAPLKPALSLGCGRLVVVATHPAVYPASPATDRDQGPPDVDDMMVRVLDAALVDRMVEDLRTLGKINELVAEGRRTGASQRRYVYVPYLFFGPEERGTLGALAATSFDDRYRWPGGALRTIRNPDLPLLGQLLGGDGPAEETFSATRSSTAPSSTPQSAWDDGMRNCSWRTGTAHPGSRRLRSTSLPTGSRCAPRSRRTAQRCDIHRELGEPRLRSRCPGTPQHRCWRSAPEGRPLIANAVTDVGP